MSTLLPASRCGAIARASNNSRRNRLAHRLNYIWVTLIARYGPITHMWFCDKDIEKLSLQLKSRCCRSEYYQTAKSCSDVQRLQRPQNFWHKVRCSLSVNSCHAFYFSDAKHTQCPTIVNRRHFFGSSDATSAKDRSWRPPDVDPTPLVKRTFKRLLWGQAAA